MIKNIKATEDEIKTQKKKYIIHIISLIVNAINIQDMWLIDENAIILRNFIIFKPPRAPTSADKAAEEMVICTAIEESIRQEIRNIGASF